MPSVMKIQILEGNVAPRYTARIIKTAVDNVVVTEEGMKRPGTKKGFPLVDFQLSDDYGNNYYLAVTGSHLLMLAAAIKGINLRNHGEEEP